MTVHSPFCPVCIKRSHFSGFNMATAAILGRHFEFKNQKDSKYNEYHYIRSAKQELVENDTS